MINVLDKMKSTFWVIFAVFFFLTGCMTEEEVAPQSEDIRTIIQQYADQLNVDKNEIQQSNAMKTLGTYYVISGNTFGFPLDFSMENFSFYHPGLRKAAGSTGFDFEGMLGIYEWDPESGSFIRSGEDTDFIRLSFPSNAENRENNAELKILDYEEIPINDENTIEVTSINMQLTVDGVLEMSLDYTAGYDNMGNLGNLDMDLLIAPFTLTLDLAQSKGVIQVNSSWKKDGNPLLSSYFLIARNNLNFTAYEDFPFSGKTSGCIKYRDLKLDGSFDFSNVELEKADKGEAVQMALYKGSRKLGRLYIDFETDGERFVPGTTRYFIDCTEKKDRISADRLIKPLFDGFNDIL
jgi:hypothetical protein